MKFSRRIFLQTGVLAALGSGLPDRKYTASGAQHQHSGDHPAVHGMVVMGEKTIFLSHLPLFKTATYNSPHDYQVILQATFRHATQNATQIYRKDRKQTKTRLYTLEPEKFVLPTLAGPVSDVPHRTEFQGTLYRGHFERGGEPILKNLTVQVSRVVHFRKFDPQAARPNQLQYLMFGTTSEQFLAHFISKPPDFDQILAVRSLTPKISEADLRQCPILSISDRSDATASKLAEGFHGPIRLQTSKAALAGQLAIRTEIYFEADELSP